MYIELYTEYIHIYIYMVLFICIIQENAFANMHRYDYAESFPLAQPRIAGKCIDYDPVMNGLGN